MSKEPTIARESGVSPLNATSSSSRTRVTQKKMDSVASSFNDNVSSDKFIEGLSYDRGTVTAYTMEKGYGDNRSYEREYTSAPSREERGWR